MGFELGVEVVSDLGNERLRLCRSKSRVLERRGGRVGETDGSGSCGGRNFEGFWNRGDSVGALQDLYPCDVCQRGRTQQAQFLLWPRIKDFATAQTASADSYQESLRVPEQGERYALASVATFWARLVHGWKDRSWGDGGVCSWVRDCQGDPGGLPCLSNGALISWEYSSITPLT